MEPKQLSFRLYDEKCQKAKIGDYIEFSNIVFQQVLKKFFQGAMDEKTFAILGKC